MHDTEANTGPDTRQTTDGTEASASADTSRRRTRTRATQPNAPEASTSDPAATGTGAAAKKATGAKKTSATRKAATAKAAATPVAAAVKKAPTAKASTTKAAAKQSTKRSTKQATPATGDPQDTSATTDTPPAGRRAAAKTTTRRAAAKKSAPTPAAAATAPPDPAPSTETAPSQTPAKRATKRTTKKSAGAPADTGAVAADRTDPAASTGGAVAAGSARAGASDVAPARTAASKSTRKTTKQAPPEGSTPAELVEAAESGGLFVAPGQEAAPTRRPRTRRGTTATPLFQAPEPTTSSSGATAPAARRPATDTAVADTRSTDAPATEGPAVEGAAAEGKGAPTSTRTSSRSRSRTRSSGTAAAATDGPATDTPTTTPAAGAASDDATAATGSSDEVTTSTGDSTDTSTEGSTSSRRRRRRGGRGRKRKPSDGSAADAGAAAGTDATPASDPTAESGTGGATAGNGRSVAASPDARTDAAAGKRTSTDDGATEATPAEEPPTSGTSTSSRRRRSRRRAGDTATAPAPDDPPQTVVRLRESRPSTDDDVTSVKGSTRLEAKKQRRRDGRDSGRRRTPIVSEAEFLARRESVERVMVVRQAGSRTQIGVLEDGILVEHYVAQASQTSSVGNVYLGKVQNVLPAMEAAFIDIGKGRNGVLYAGEVAWARMGMENGKPRRMESVLSSGQSVLVQVTKDPVGHKGARLTGLVSLPGRFLVYAPGGSMSGISRKLPEQERNRLKSIVKKVFPDEASVIIRTAAEGTSEEELSNDIHRLEAQWLDIEAKAKSATAPARLYAEPDLAIKVVRDMFNEDFAKLVISGDEAWDILHTYVSQVAPDLVDRLTHWDSDKDIFAEHQIDEQIAKALDRKVWLPSGGSLVIDRTEAMTVVDVNTGKFTGSGGNLEATVTKNNLEAAEEIVRQIRLRDVGGIIVIDFIDMVLESNRDLVLRRLVECLGRDRTRHQVAEVTSLGLVQMTRKRVGQGLLDVFSEPCQHCSGRGLIIHYEPVDHDGPSTEHEQTPQPAVAGRSQSSGRSGRSSRSGRRDSATPVIEPAGRPGPAEVIRAVAKAAANGSRGPETEPAETESAGDDADGAAAADARAVESATRGDAPSPGSEASTASGLDQASALDSVEVFASAATDGSADASATAGPSAAAGSQPDSGASAAAPRARRTRSTRRPAGPPRPVITTDSPTASEPATTATASERATVAAGADGSSPAGQSTNEPPTDGLPMDVESLDGQPAAAEPSATAPRRRRGRATRPAGAPTA